MDTTTNTNEPKQMVTVEKKQLENLVANNVKLQAMHKHSMSIIEFLQQNLIHGIDLQKFAYSDGFRILQRAWKIKKNYDKDPTIIKEFLNDVLQVIKLNENLENGKKKC